MWTHAYRNACTRVHIINTIFTMTIVDYIPYYSCLIIKCGIKKYLVKPSYLVFEYSNPPSSTDTRVSKQVSLHSGCPLIRGTDILEWGGGEGFGYGYKNPLYTYTVYM